MGVVIGIDVGGSTTKIVGVENKTIKSPMFVKAIDPVTSLGASVNISMTTGITLPEIEMVMLTGGSAFIDQPLYGLPTAKTDEFLANGLGAQYAAHRAPDRRKHGNGNLFRQGGWTAYPTYRRDRCRRRNLAWTLPPAPENARHPPDLRYGFEGNSDEYRPPDTGYLQPASARPSAGCHRLQLRKSGRQRLPEDIASGSSTWSCNRSARPPSCQLNSPIQDFVLIGNLTQLPQCKEIFPKLEEMYGVRFLIPKYSEYRTAIGAALTYINGSTVHPVR